MRQLSLSFTEARPIQDWLIQSNVKTKALSVIIPVMFLYMTCPSLWYVLLLFSSLFNKCFTTVKTTPLPWSSFSIQHRHLSLNHVAKNKASHIFLGKMNVCDNSAQQRLCLALRTFWPTLKVFFLGQSSSCWSLGKHVFYTSYADDALDSCYPWTYAALRHLTYLTWMSNKTGGLLVQVCTFSN